MRRALYNHPPLWKTVLLVLCMPVWLPVRCILGPRRKRERSTYGESDKLARKRQELNAPPTLPAVRSRALTLPLPSQDISTKRSRKKTSREDSNERVLQATHNQVESSILYTLPLEIRTMIWQYAITGHHIHIARKRRRLGHAVCPRPDVIANGGEDLCTRLRDGNGFWISTQYPLRVRLLSLVKSCRQIYSETIDMLYAGNTFSFADPLAFTWFYSSVLPSRMQQLRSIEIATEYLHSSVPGQSYAYDRRPPHDSATWKQTCNVLAALPHLHDLRVLLSDRSTSRSYSFALSDTRDDPETLSALLDLKPQSTFQVIVPYHFEVPRQIQLGLDLAKKRFGGGPDSVPFTLSRARGCTYDVAEFVVPFNVRCLHCGDGTLILEGVRTRAERCIIMSEEIEPSQEAYSLPPSDLYRVRHGKCGGWLEFETELISGSWRATHGAERLE